MRKIRLATTVRLGAYLYKAKLVVKCSPFQQVFYLPNVETQMFLAQMILHHLDIVQYNIGLLRA